MPSQPSPITPTRGSTPQEKREEHAAAKLADSAVDIQYKIKIATDVRDCIDGYNSQGDYARFVDVLLPAFLALLGNGRYSFHSQSPEHKLRHLLLETLHRLGHNEALKTRALDLMNLLLVLMEHESEENAITALKIAIDLHRTYKDVVGPTASAFINMVKQLYQNMSNVVAELFGTAQAHFDPVPGENEATRQLPPGSKSLKLLSECPIAVVFLFQTYRDVVARELALFFPVIFQFLELQAAPQAAAHQKAKEQGELFVGMCSALQGRRAQLGELLTAQIKTLSFLAYVLRISSPTLIQQRSAIPEVAVRLLKDCPADASAHRKELLIATRHILTSPEYRSDFFPYIDTLLQDRVLVGAGITSFETLRPLAYSMMADLVHHCRQELSINTLDHVVHVYACNLHDTTLAASIQTMCAKLLFNSMDTIVQTGHEFAPKLIRRTLEAFVARLEALAKDKDTWADWMRPKASKQEMEKGRMDEVDIERCRPVAANAAMTDPGSEPVKEHWTLVRNIIHACQSSGFGATRNVNPVYVADADLVSRFFVAAVRCIGLYEVRPTDPKERKECLDGIANVLGSTSHLVFVEVVEKSMPFFLEEMVTNQELIAIPQSLLSDANKSQAMTGILFRYLQSRLEEMGCGNAALDAVILRLFKMAFLAVTLFPDLNEQVLQPHLSHIVMHSLKMASRVSEPRNHYTLLRVLFRSIGGGRFELLYKEVIPLLEVLLVNLVGLLKSATDKQEKNLFVELCLTVPVRLSVLLPYLRHLMKPLVIALESGQDLVTQGLRTLELCVDNLTPEFLNPLMAPVIHEIMGALWKLLRPLPFNHQHAHTTVRILGKIGGRNRKLVGSPRLDWRPVGKEAVIKVKFTGQPGTLPISQTIDLALRMIRRGDVHYRKHAYTYFRHATVIFLKESLALGEEEEAFKNVIKGLFEACRIEDFREECTQFITDLARYIFALEMSNTDLSTTSEAASKYVLPLSSAFLDGMVEDMASATSERSATLMEQIVKDLLEYAKVNPPVREDLPLVIVHQLAARMGSLCYDPAWSRKSGGAKGLQIMATKVELTNDWLLAHELDFVRSLIFMIKDAPSDPPSSISEVQETIYGILNRCNAPDAVTNAAERQSSTQYLIGILIAELASQVELVRVTAQAAIKCLEDCGTHDVHATLLYHRNRLLSPVFTKPLRALAFPMQIGHIDAITYCISRDKPILDTEAKAAEGEEPTGEAKDHEMALQRLLVEAHGIAEADDAALVGKANQQKNASQLVQLRIVCIRFLSAFMDKTDMMSQKQTNTRMRILSVYFKLLYAKAPEVVDAAHSCLKEVLDTQGKLPKDLLQTGLRPVLVNLSDHKRLTVANLQGLARLLELLPNYFKVEIGQKLLDHLRAFADPATLIQNATNSHQDNAELATMAAVVNVFRLLPHPAASVFLADVVNVVVETEANLRKTFPTVFTVPLGRFMERYTSESVAALGQNMQNRSFVSTYSNVISNTEFTELREATTVFLLDEFAAKLTGAEQTEYDQAALHAILLLQTLAKSTDDWLSSNRKAIQTLKDRWLAAPQRHRRATQGEVFAEQYREDCVTLDIFLTSLNHSLDVDLLFTVLEIFQHRSPGCPATLPHYFYSHVVTSKDVALRQAVLDRFIQDLPKQDVAQVVKVACLRYLINPILLVSFARGDDDIEIANVNFVNKVNSTLWQPWLAEDMASWCTDEALRVELVFLSTLIVRGRWQVTSDARKDVIKFAWTHIKSEDLIMKHTTNGLNAQFLAVYESPAKIVTPIYTALLRAHQPESKALVRDALDVLVPVLPERCPPTEDAMSWSTVTRRVMMEDGHSNMAQLTHIYHLFIRHPDIFFERRDLFVPSIISSLNKFTLSAQSTSETRTLAVELVDLIVTWEKKRISRIQEQGDKMDIDQEEPEKEKVSPRRSSRRERAPSTTAGASSSMQSAASAASYALWPVPLHLRDTVINAVLIRFIATNPEYISKSVYGQKAIALLKEVLAPSFWGDAAVKFSFFVRVLSESDLDTNEKNLPLLCNTAEELCIVIANKSEHWLKENFAQLQKIVEKALSNPESKLHIALRPVIEQVFIIAVANTMEETPLVESCKAFLEWAKNVIEEGLRESSNVHGTMTLLEAWAAAAPDGVEPFVGPLSRLLNVLCKEHISNPPPATLEMSTKLLKSAFNLLKTRMVAAADNRRWVLSALCLLVDKSPSVEMCHLALDIASLWILESKENYPTLREKTSLLQKMLIFEHRNDDTLLRDYLQLILNIYQHPMLSRMDYSIRLQQPFMLGCRTRDPVLRNQFMDIFDHAIAKSIHGRLGYLLGAQDWEWLAETNWIHQALDLLLGTVDGDQLLYEDPGMLPSGLSEDFLTQIRSLKTQEMFLAARKLLYADAETSHQVWMSTFSSMWSRMNRRHQGDITRFLINLLTKEYHLLNVERRPNVIQTLLGGALACSPPITLPPHLVRYLGKTYNAHHTAAELLQDVVEDYKEEESVRETSLDALAETYAELAEDDSLYGLWRRRAYYTETNIAISFEQAGLWNQAQQMYESAQLKARSGSMPFTESEYNLWEDHWVICAEKLQQWDILYDLAKQESNSDLLLECAWRSSDWLAERDSMDTSISEMNPVPTPRRRVYEAFMALVRISQGEDKKVEFNRCCEEGIQYSLRKWYHLPEIVSQAHIPLLHVFQQFVELQEASQIVASLAVTNVGNIDQRSQELKAILGSWRDRLPNTWDDINMWSDIVGWRQHVFRLINAAYAPLIPTGNGASSNASSYAYRGHHETAWIINRFAHVARKHNLIDVCIGLLTKIYTLPNIEIQEAFLKLREQAKCHYQNPYELTTGLEVINNTNLMYFAAHQKAEFFTMKGMFMARLNMHEEAAQVFNQAVLMDMSFPKVWAEWGRYHDRMFKENPSDLSIAANALSCYLQAAGLYKNGKVRKFLIRVLWLLSLDDATSTVAKAFDAYKGEQPTWYWIVFLPQLTTALAHREARYARMILIKIAKSTPQALYYHLRTAREEFATQRLENEKKAAAAQGSNAPNPTQNVEVNGGLTTGPPGTVPIPQPGPQNVTQPDGTVVNVPILVFKFPGEIIDEIFNILKTAFPLLSLSMEFVGDQIHTRFKASSDEDIYRLVTALLYDALTHLVNRSLEPVFSPELHKTTQLNLQRFASNLPANLREDFARDFVEAAPNLKQYIETLQAWRDRYEQILDRKPKKHPLESMSHWLMEFQYQKLDELEIPGQYLRHTDNNRDFPKIDHFKAKIDAGRLGGIFTRRLTLVATDGSQHSFSIQYPAPRFYRREERIMQLFRMLNCTLETKKEARKRGLNFSIPLTMSMSPIIRFVESDLAHSSLQDVYEEYCASVGMSKDDPVLAWVEKMRALTDASKDQPFDVSAARLEVYNEIRDKMFPDDILKKFMTRSMASPGDLWHVRKQMTQHLAAFMFQTYLFSIRLRLPTNMLFSRSTGALVNTDILPCTLATKPEFGNGEAVPFRFTPNIQRFITAIGVEGVLSSSLLAIARSLTESDYDLEHRLVIFVNEEMNTWYNSHKTPRPTDAGIRDLALSNTAVLVRRAKLLSCKQEREKPPGQTACNQTIIELLSHATNPLRLAQIDPAALPWL